MAKQWQETVKRTGGIAGSFFVVLVCLALVIPFALLWFPAHLLYGQWLRLRWELTWGRQGKRILLVYSRSPIWQEYIENNWLPYVGPHAVVVDWSDRAAWPKWAPLEVRAFRYWGGDRDFNPMVVLFPRRGSVRTIRFWRAFRDFKHGNGSALEKAECELISFAGEPNVRLNHD